MLTAALASGGLGVDSDDEGWELACQVEGAGEGSWDWDWDREEDGEAKRDRRRLRAGAGMSQMKRLQRKEKGHTILI